MTAIGISDQRPRDPRRLRELAAWYREFAERAGNPIIWEARLRTAAELEQEAVRLEEGSERPREAVPIPGDQQYSEIGKLAGATAGLQDARAV